MLDRVRGEDPKMNFDAFKLLQDELDESDLAFLKSSCKAHLNKDDAIPSFVFIDETAHPTVRKIQQAVEIAVGEPLFYLNDFYLYTEGKSSADWHVDTELFTFERAYNAWLLLSPDEVESPLAVMSDWNAGDDPFFHTLKVGPDGEQAQLVNMKTAARQSVSMSDIEATKIEAPDVSVGDILVLNPKRFHRTNIQSPKHIIAFKFVALPETGFLSEQQVPSLLWPEVEIFNKAVRGNTVWGGVLDDLREAMTTEKGRKALSAGFFPERLPFFRENVAKL